MDTALMNMILFVVAMARRIPILVALNGPDLLLGQKGSVMMEMHPRFKFYSPRS